MYLCFEAEDKRMVYPEHSLVGFDDNGFILKSAYNARTGDTIFVKLSSYKGSVESFKKALSWINQPGRTREAESSLPENPDF